MLLPKSLLFILAGTAFFASAGMQIGATRVIYPATQNEVLLSIENNSSDPELLVQAWVDNINDKGKAPFIVTPPLFKLDSNQSSMVHFIYTGENSASLPVDRESVFWANIKSIAATPASLENESKLQLAARTRIKLFYRPAGLSSNDARQAWRKLTFSRHGKLLKVKNPTPFYITLQALSVDGQAVSAPKDTLSALSMMISPFGEKDYSLGREAGTSVSWQAINDFGTQTEWAKSVLK